MQSFYDTTVLEVGYSGKRCSVVLRQGCVFLKDATERTEIFVLIGTLSLADNRAVLHSNIGIYDCAIDEIEVIAPEKSE